MDFQIFVFNLKDGVIREEIPATRLAYTERLGDVGAGEFSVPTLLRSGPIHYASRQVVETGATGVCFVKGSIPLWAGPIWSASTWTFDSRTVFKAGDWLSYYNRQLLRHTLSYTGVDQLDVARSFIQYVQTLDPGIIEPLYDATLSGVLRNETYNHYERLNIGRILKLLSERSNGFEFRFYPTWKPDESGFDINFQTYYPTAGRRKNIILEWGANIEEIMQEDDASDMANYISSIGAGEGSDMLIQDVQDVGVRSVFPLLQDYETHKDITVAATLESHARKRLQRKRLGIDSLRVKVNAEDDQLPPGSWAVGDSLQVFADYGRIQVSGYRRLLEYESRVTTEGSETLTFTFDVEQTSQGGL